MAVTAETKSSYQKAVDILGLCMAVAMGLFHMFSASFGTWSSYVLSATHWAFVGSYIVLRHPFKKLGVIGRIYDWAIIALTVWVCYYQVAMQARLVYSAGFYSALDIAVAIIAVFLIMEVGRRSVGNILPIIAGCFLLYSYYGNMISGLLRTTKFTVRRIALFLYTSSDGVFGQTLYVSAKYIFLFILFGSILELTGAGEFFVDLAYAAVGKVRGGPAQAAVYSSMLMGTINGSGAANVVTTGTFTIPLMKKIGIKPSTAGAIEAVASSGGQIMPPVMGAVAFLMAEMTGIKYAEIALAALVPALLYYLTLSVSVYFIARRDKLEATDPSELKNFWVVLKQGWLFLTPLAILIYLIVKGASVQISAFYAILTSLGIGFIKNRPQMTLKNIGNAFESALKSIAPVAAACALAGVVMGSISLTGLGLKISSLIEMLAGGNLLLALFFSMIASLILGMGLPTSAAYMVLAVLVAPALVNMGVTRMAAHLFLLYFGALSTITPPVALSTFAAAGISGAGVWETGWEGMKLASTGLIIPYIFAYDTSLLLLGEPFNVIMAIITAVIGCIILSMAVSGWGLRPLGLISRLLLAVAGVMMIISDPLWINGIGLALAAVVLIAVIGIAKKKPA